MKLVYSFQHKGNESISELCRNSKNLYNQANYIVRQEFIKKDEYVKYGEMDKVMKNVMNLDGELNYRKLPAQSAQQILRLLDKNWKSFFKSIDDWIINEHKYKGEPSIPGYIRNDEYIAILTNQLCKIKNNRIRMKKFNINIRVPKYEGKDFTRFQQVRIIPKQGFYNIEIVYEQEPIKADVDSNKVLAIDLGINNFITMVDTEGNKPVIINGRPLKSVNQLFNKKTAKLRSIYTNGKTNCTGSTKQITNLTNKRNNQINDYLHKVSDLVVSYAIKKGIGTVCIGELNGLKSSIKLGKRQNQQIVQIPLARFKQKLEYKCKLVGIVFKTRNEAYTSKCDALGLEAIKKHTKYMGKRIKRGLFRSSRGLLNADVNGALNILRKVIGDTSFMKLIDSRTWFCPVRIREINPISFKQFLVGC